MFNFAQKPNNNNKLALVTEYERFGYCHNYCDTVKLGLELRNTGNANIICDVIFQTWTLSHLESAYAVVYNTPKNEIFEECVSILRSHASEVLLTLLGIDLPIYNEMQISRFKLMALVQSCLKKSSDASQGDHDELNDALCRIDAYVKTNIAPFPASNNSEGTRVPKIDLALATLAKNPGWTTRQIANHVGTREDSLSKYPRFKKARKAQKPERQPASYDVRTGGRQIESE